MDAQLFEFLEQLNIGNKTCFIFDKYEKLWRDEEIRKNANRAIKGTIACNYCEKTNIELLRCSNCNNTHYCCRSHQKKDWKNHKKICHKIDKYSTEENPNKRMSFSIQNHIGTCKLKNEKSAFQIKSKCWKIDGMFNDDEEYAFATELDFDEFVEFNKKNNNEYIKEKYKDTLNKGGILLTYEYKNVIYSSAMIF